MPEIFEQKIPSSIFSSLVEEFKEMGKLVYTPKEFEFGPGSSIRVTRDEEIYAYPFNDNTLRLEQGLVRLPAGLYHVLRSGEVVRVLFSNPRSSGLRVGTTHPWKVTVVTRAKKELYLWFDHVA